MIQSVIDRQPGSSRTDGTPEGTIKLGVQAPRRVSVSTIFRQFNKAVTSLEPTWFATHGDILYFVADGGDGEELWKTDGTSEGTVQIVDLFSGPDSSAPSSLTTIGTRYENI